MTALTLNGVNKHYGDKHALIDAVKDYIGGKYIIKRDKMDSGNIVVR